MTAIVNWNYPPDPAPGFIGFGTPRGSMFVIYATRREGFVNRRKSEHDPTMTDIVLLVLNPNPGEPDTVVGLFKTTHAAQRAAAKDWLERCEKRAT